MNINDLRKLSRLELEAKLTEERGKLFVLRFQIAAGKTNNFSEVKKIKNLIAQILTILKEQKSSNQSIISEKKISPIVKKT